MLKKFLGRDSDSFNATEEAAVDRVAGTLRRLVLEGGRINTKSEAGYNACALFLDALEAGARALRVEAAPRSYRDAFTINYRALFPDDERNYRVDVLEASVEQYAVIWVNGEKFEFSPQVMDRAETLQRRWYELAQLLDRWNHASAEGRSSSLQRRSSARPSRNEMRGAFVALDWSWASFEHKYIAELINIEERARRIVVEAIEHERRLQQLEAHFGKSEALLNCDEYCQEQTQLVQCLGRLNSVANFKRKGRDDLAVDILLDAFSITRRCDASANGCCTDHGSSCRDCAGAERYDHDLSAARVLANDVIESWTLMREYLSEVERCLERLDPHLCNNAGLVARLVDWEESWEIASRYLQNEQLLMAVCDLVSQIRAAQDLVPELTAMCEECDVELFMVLPRIIWVRFLAKPVLHAELLQGLLPHRFLSKAEGAGGTEAPTVDGDLGIFVCKYAEAKEMLVKAQTEGSGKISCPTAAEQAAWEVIVRRVILGASSIEEAYRGLAPGQQEDAKDAVEELMHELERWSIELQRHCAEDWNQCSAVLVQCLTSSEGEKTKEPFKV